jgi:hypothetical protein
VQHERSGGRHVGYDEGDAGLHQPGDEVDMRASRSTLAISKVDR